LNKTLLSTM